MSMAPKRRNEDPLERKAHSSDDEESEEDEEESSSEDTTTPAPPTNPKSQSSSSADSGSDSDSDDQTNTRAISAVVAPPPANNVVKPAEKSATKSARSKPPSTPVKRTAEPQSEKKDSKRAKKGDGASSEKARPRIWSDEDEIGVLKGMIEFQEKNGVSPNSNLSAFYDYIKKSLRADVSKTQVSDKIRHMKTKYLTVLEKDGNGSGLKPHDKQLFDLACRIWGETNGVHSEEPKSIKKPKKVKNDGPSTLHSHKPEQPVEAPKDVPPSRDLVEILSSDNYGEIQDYVLKKGLDLVEESDRAELEKKWAKLRKAELEVFVERCELVCTQAKLVLEAYK